MYDMDDKTFLYETKKALVGERQGAKIVKKLVRLGFVVDSKGQNGHWHLYHERLRGYKLTISSSVSDWRSGYNTLRDIRHAMLKAAA